MRLCSDEQDSDEQTSGVYASVGRGAHGAARPARPEIVDRTRVIRLMEERRYEDVVVLLRAAQRRRPYDLEIMRSLRILELHLADRTGARTERNRLRRVG